MRYVYNKLVEKVAKNGEKYDRKAFQKFCSMMRQETPWMQEVTSRATYEAADAFHASMQNFFDSCSGKRKGEHMGLPTFKERGSKDFFRFSHNSQFKVSDRELRLSGSVGSPIRMRERIRFAGAVKSVSIRRRGKNWFASFCIDAELKSRPCKGARESNVGVDLGLTCFAVTSEGERIESPRPLRAMETLLAKRQRQASRKVRGSNRRAKAMRQIACYHVKIVNIRKAFTHQAANRLIDGFDRIVIEDLSVRGMANRKRHLGKGVYDSAFGEFRRILEYKAKANGCEIVVADRFFPSSQLDHKTGERVEGLTLRNRVIHHKDGTTTDRDHNAAMNLAAYQPTNRTSPPIRGRQKTYAGGESLRLAVESVNTETQLQLEGSR